MFKNFTSLKYLETLGYKVDTIDSKAIILYNADHAKGIRLSIKPSSQKTYIEDSCLSGENGGLSREELKALYLFWEEYNEKMGINMSEINFDNIIFSAIDEDDADVECLYQTWKKIYEDYLKEEINRTKGDRDMSIQELRQIFKDKLANAEDSYQHFTMVDKDAALAYYAQENIKLYKEVLALIDRLEEGELTNG